MRLLRWLIPLLLVASPAVAQWQVSAGGVPIGRGVGVTGFNSVAAVAAGQPLISGGVAPAVPLYAGSWVKFDVANQRVVFRKNTATESNVGANTVLLVDQADGQDGVVEARAYGSALKVPVFQGSKAGGTLAARTSVQSGDKLAQFLAAGWNGGTSTYDVVGGLTFQAAENFSSGHSGSASKMALVTPGTFSELIVHQWFGTGKSATGAGNLTDPQAALAISNNTTASIASTANATLQVIGADAASSTIDIASFGAASAFNLGRANNTAASKTAVASGDNVGAIFGAGWDTASYIQSAGFRFNANQTFSVGANGTSIIALTTANGSATLGEAARFWGSKSLSVGPSGTADPAASGVINVATGYRVANAATSGNVLRGDGTNFISATLGAIDVTNNGVISYKSTGVNFNSANTDTSFTLTAPPGTYSRYQILRGYISHCSASATTATFGVFSAAAGAGTAIVATGTAVTVSTASENTANNTQSMTLATGGSGSTTSINFTPIFFRVQTPQGSAVTCDVTFQIQWIS